MKKIALITALTLIGGAGYAQQETARVVSVTPIMQQVSVPRQVCTNEAVTSAPQKSGAGAVMGAIAGGAMGNAVGGGNGRAAATMLGLVGGAILGDKIEGPEAAPQVQTVQRCSTRYVMENRITSYQVIYEFGGKQYSVQMPHDPGATIRLQLTPISAAASDTTLASIQAEAYPVAVIRPAVSIGFSGENYNRHGWR
jgi:uncharacterized protein YcfJ